MKMRQKELPTTVMVGIVIAVVVVAGIAVVVLKGGPGPSTTTTTSSTTTSPTTTTTTSTTTSTPTTTTSTTTTPPHEKELEVVLDLISPYGSYLENNPNFASITFSEELGVNPQNKLDEILGYPETGQYRTQYRGQQVDLSLYCLWLV
jgi:hypothetical protein